MDWKLVVIPLIGGLIGWLTNALAVKMIFRPRRPLRFLGLTVQGLVPKRREDLARSIASTVEQHLISHADIEAILNREDVHQMLDATIQTRIREFVDVRLRAINPMIGMFLSGDLRGKIETVLREEVARLVPELSGRMMETLEAELDFRRIVEEKVRAFDLIRLEQIIFEIAARELKAIELIGGLLGVLIGLVQVAIMMI